MKNLLPLLLLVSSCATYRPKNPVRVEKDSYEKVSVQTSLDLAFTSYLMACTQIMKENDQDNYFDNCKRRASDHVKNNILFILKQ